MTTYSNSSISPTVLVEFVGLTGSGKSTLVPLVVKALEEISNQPELCNAAQNPGLLNSTRALTRNPHLVTKTVSFCKQMKGKYGNFIGYLYWLRRFSKNIWHQPVAPNVNSNGIWVFDEGIVHYLRKSKRPLSSKFLQQFPLPDLVVHVQANWEDRMQRIIHRQRPLYKGEISTGEKRLLKSKSIAEGFLYHYSHAETLNLLQKWSLKFCKPPLTKKELAKVVEKAPPKEKKKGDSSATWLKPTLNSLGIKWLDFTNSRGSDPEKTSEKIAVAIWEQYLNEARAL